MSTLSTYLIKFALPGLCSKRKLPGGLPMLQSSSDFLELIQVSTSLVLPRTHNKIAFVALSETVG